MIASIVRAIIISVLLSCLTTLPGASYLSGITTAQAQTQADEKPTVKLRQLLLQRRKAAADQSSDTPAFMDDPKGWIQAKQRAFYGKMSKALTDIKRGSVWTAAITLMALSFAYGILHAAGPGHGKAVVSAWLLANERQLKRGVMISFMAAFVQAMTAIVLVSVLLFTVNAAARTAKSMAQGLEAVSYGLIALTGLWLIWQALRPRFVAVQAHGHNHHHEHHHDHVHGPDCGCGHAHMPSAAELNESVNVWNAASIAFAVGIRPCTGGILVLLFSSAIGLYWVGIISTLFMALGTAITVSTIACLAVKSRDLALKFSGHSTLWLDRTAFGLKLLGGLFIACVGGLLFWATATNTAPLI
jgi:ABC-type nickel/cobalt efflux system permease component RcnA